ncbi:MAG TPA: cytochrome c maturation protein CcmE [Gaiellaceae bacterium]|nr:cytochrome c maturation protein CcmE [Gaiellaceae bacterium]
MAQRPRSVRLVLALSVAAVLAIFLLYVSIAGGRTAQFSPSELPAHANSNVSLVGKVVAPVKGEGYSRDGLRFRVADINGSKSVPVVYHGTVPDQFKLGRHVVVDGRYANGVFVAKRDSLVTKCPSKYAPKKS